jgi:hypothetical protein
MRASQPETQVLGTSVLAVTGEPGVGWTAVGLLLAVAGALAVFALRLEELPEAAAVRRPRAGRASQSGRQDQR